MKRGESEKERIHLFSDVESKHVALVSVDDHDDGAFIREVPFLPTQRRSMDELESCFSAPKEMNGRGGSLDVKFQSQYLLDRFS